MRLFVLFAMFFGIAINSQAQDGEQLFRTNCSACHTVGEGRLVGPDLKGIHDRAKEKWIIQFIKSSSAMIEKKDPRAVQIFEEFNQVPMPDQDLSDAEIKSVLAYIKLQSGGAEPATVAVAGGSDPGAAAGDAGTATAENKTVSAAPAKSSSAVSNPVSSNVVNEAPVPAGPFSLDTIDYMMLIFGTFFVIIIWYLGRVIVQLSALLNDKYTQK